MITINFEDLDVEIGLVTGYFDVDHNKTEWWTITPITGTITDKDGYIVTEFIAKQGQILFSKIILLLGDQINEDCLNSRI